MSTKPPVVVKVITKGEVSAKDAKNVYVLYKEPHLHSIPNRYEDLVTDICSIWADSAIMDNLLRKKLQPWIQDLFDLLENNNLAVLYIKHKSKTIRYLSETILKKVTYEVQGLKI